MTSDINPYASPQAADDPEYDSIPAGRRSRARKRPFRSPTFLSRLLAILLFVVIATHAMYAALLLGQIQNSIPGPYASEAISWGLSDEETEAEAVDVIMGLGALVGAIALLVAFVVFLCWLARVHGNLPALLASRLRFTSAGVIASCFIPLVNFVVPYEGFKEVWRGSTPGKAYRGDSRLPVPGWLLLWWLIFLTSNIPEAMGDRLFELAATWEQVRMACWLTISSAVMTVVASAACWRYVHRVTKRQLIKSTQVAELIEKAAAEGRAAEI